MPNMAANLFTYKILGAGRRFILGVFALENLYRISDAATAFNDYMSTLPARFRPETGKLGRDRGVQKIVPQAYG
jgi:hypothetical protein